jgi:radical SAM superfamily enzyme YgiQ (UPF0313 family)
MKKKPLILTAALALTLGVATIAYATEKDNITARQNLKPSAIKFEKLGTNNIQNSMLDIMRENGYADIANEVEKGNYKAMDDFMNNLTDEDFNKMIEIMRENGNEGMANMMERVGREGMIQMHTAMGGAASCHGSNSSTKGMMGGSF